MSNIIKRYLSARLVQMGFNLTPKYIRQAASVDVALVGGLTGTEIFKLLTRKHHANPNEVKRVKGLMAEGRYQRVISIINEEMADWSFKLVETLESQDKRRRALGPPTFDIEANCSFINLLDRSDELDVDAEWDELTEEVLVEIDDLQEQLGLEVFTLIDGNSVARVLREYVTPRFTARIEMGCANMDELSSARGEQLLNDLTPYVFEDFYYGRLQVALFDAHGRELSCVRIPFRYRDMDDPEVIRAGRTLLRRVIDNYRNDKEPEVF